MIEYKDSYGKKVKIKNDLPSDMLYDDYGNKITNDNTIYLVTQYKDRDDSMVGIYPINQLDENLIMSMQPIKYVVSCDILNYV